MIFFVLLYVLLGQSLFQSPLRIVRGNAFSKGGPRWMALDGNVNERGSHVMPLVDLEEIKYFFNNEKITLVTDQCTEQIVSDILVEAGFSSFPVAYDVIPRVKMELPNLILGELDALFKAHRPL